MLTEFCVDIWESVIGWIQLWWFMLWGILWSMTSWLLPPLELKGQNVFIWDQIYIKLDSNSKTSQCHTPCVHDVVIHVYIRLNNWQGSNLNWKPTASINYFKKHSIFLSIHVLSLRPENVKSNPIFSICKSLTVSNCKIHWNWYSSAYIHQPWVELVIHRPSA